MNEIWKDIKGYEGIYKVSNMGRVMNVNTGKVLTINTKASDTASVTLSKSKAKNTTKCVARLVWETFSGEELSRRFYLVNKDGDRLNNALDNLELHDKTDRVLLANAPVGSARKDSKLDDDKACVILMATYIQDKVDTKLMLLGKLARAYGVTTGTATMVAKKKRWRHVTLNEADIQYCDDIISTYSVPSDIIDELLKYKRNKEA